MSSCSWGCLLAMWLPASTGAGMEESRRENGDEKRRRKEESIFFSFFPLPIHFASLLLPLPLSHFFFIPLTHPLLSPLLPHSTSSLLLSFPPSPLLSFPTLAPWAANHGGLQQCSLRSSSPPSFFGTGFILNFFIWGSQSSGAVPFTTVVLCGFF